MVQKNADLKESVVPKPGSQPCPVCGVPLAVPFFAGGQAPLATLGWPRTREEAQAMPRYPLDFVQCAACGHVWNRAFRYEDVPYDDQPNRMFNTGLLWRGHLAELADATLALLPENPCVVEIGCGCGHFLQALAARRSGRYFGFDPHGQAQGQGAFAFEARLFLPEEDLPHLAPDLVVLRHVLEHFTAPAAFLLQLAWAASRLPQPVRLLVEVPCIDRVFTTGRLADFFYEHPQQFSTASLRTLLERAGAIERLWHAYDGEVVLAVLRFQVPAAWQERAQAAARFAQQALKAKATIAAQLATLARSGQRVVIWGGTGKAAAFMHYYGVDGERFPCVVDSDPDKVGTFVPGCGQPIRSPEELVAHPPDVVIIPTQWRALDIVTEMAQRGITPRQVLIEHGGRLIDFWREPHPYTLPIDQAVS